MSVVSEVAQVPAAIIKPFLSPKTLLIGAGVFIGTGAILTYLLPGLGQFAGLRAQPLLPQFSDKLNVWPFVPMAMNGRVNGSSAMPSSATPGPSQEDLGRSIVNASVNSAQGYVNSMLQVI